MFFTLLVVTFVLSLLVSVILVRVFKQPVALVSDRVTTDIRHFSLVKRKCCIVQLFGKNF